MKLAIRFPTQIETVTEEVARFRALSADGRIQALGEINRVYQFLLANAVRPDASSQLARDDEDRGRSAILAFMVRHG